MIDEETLRRVVREEIDRILPRLAEPKLQLSIQDAALRYRRSYNFVRDLIITGQIRANQRDRGRGGRPQYFISTEDADAHPQLGGAL